MVVSPLTGFTRGDERTGGMFGGQFSVGPGAVTVVLSFHPSLPWKAKP